VSGEPLIGSGRDAELLDLGAGRVLRRPRRRRSLQAEAALMRHVRDAGYPVPRVHEVRDDGLVMDRVDGPTLLDDLAARPWRVWRHAATLARLHSDLHAIPAADGLPAPFGGPTAGDVVVHGDLHPGNVMLSAAGPVVIDWSNGGRGPAGADVADAWLLLDSGQPPGGPLMRSLVTLLRGRFLAAFLRGVDRGVAARHLRTAAERRAADPNLSAAETAAMWRLVAAHGD
jgi:aminoglycoside phosphotransferase (APT) family kinase protein